jgi:hypothetical protein
MRGWMEFGRHAAAALLACTSLLGVAGNARADDASTWLEIETKYIFGFTTGSGIGIEGEREFTVDSIGRFGKRDGHYAATETKYEYEFTPSQFVQIEFGALGSTHDVGAMSDLDSRNAAGFAGGFAELRYLAVERTSNNPLSITLAFEPNVRFIDETSGARVHNYEFETTVNADLELLRNRLYAGFDLLYEPEVSWTGTGEVIREATIGSSAALSLRIVPDVLVGGEIWYLRHYDSPTLSAFAGDAIMLGPTLYVQFTPKMFMIAAWNAQVWGREAGNSLPLNLSEFQRHRARLKFAWEF